jgi:hypothetical protein
MSCNGKAHLVQWKVGFHKWKVGFHTNRLYLSKPGHVDNPVLHLHEQDALHRLVNAIDR